MVVSFRMWKAEEEKILKENVTIAQESLFTSQCIYTTFSKSLLINSNLEMAET